MSTLRLESLNLCRDYSAPYNLKGTARFKGEYGSVEIKLDERLSNEVVRLCAGSMTRATQELANNLTAEVFEQANIPQLTSVPAEVEPPNMKHDAGDDDLSF